MFIYKYSILFESPCYGHNILVIKQLIHPLGEEGAE